MFLPGKRSIGNPKREGNNSANNFGKRFAEDFQRTEPPASRALCDANTIDPPAPNSMQSLPCSSQGDVAASKKDDVPDSTLKGEMACHFVESGPIFDISSTSPPSFLSTNHAHLGESCRLERDALVMRVRTQISNNSAENTGPASSRVPLLKNPVSTQTTAFLAMAPRQVPLQEASTVPIPIIVEEPQSGITSGPLSETSGGKSEARAAAHLAIPDP